MMNFNRPKGMAGMFYQDGGKGPGDPRRATMSEQAIVDRGKDDVGHFVIYETAGGDRVRVSVPDGFEPKNNEQYDIVDFGEGFKVEFKDATDREASAPGDQFGPADPPGQRGDMFDQGGKTRKNTKSGQDPENVNDLLKALKSHSGKSDESRIQNLKDGKLLGSEHPDTWLPERVGLDDVLERIEFIHETVNNEGRDSPNNEEKADIYALERYAEMLGLEKTTPYNSGGRVVKYDQGGVMQEQGPGGLLPVGEGEVLKDNDGREYVVFENPKGEGTIKVYSDDYGWNEVDGVAEREAQGMGKFTSIPMDMEYPVNFNTETGEYELNAQMYEDQMSKQMEKKTEGFRGSIKREMESPGSTQQGPTPKGADVGGLLNQLRGMKANNGMRVLKY